MQQKKKPSALYARLVSIFKSRVTRNLIILGLLLLSVFCMFLLDNGNYIRREHFSFWETNVISRAMDLFSISRYNIGLEPWLIFLVAWGVSLIFLIANTFAPKFVARKVATNADKFHTEIGARRFYTTMYYLGVLLLAAAGVFIFVMSGGFDNYRKETTDIFLNLIYTILICLLMIVLIILCVAIFIAFLRVCFCFIGHLSATIARFVKDVEAGRELDEQALAEIERARAAGGAWGEGGKITASIENSDVGDRDLFPPLTMIDLEHEEGIKEVQSDDVALEDLVLRFQSYACNQHKVYYELPLLRSFIAGMASSRLLILQGLSGTGKSLLPRMFSRFTNSDVYFSPVQATWRDKTDVLGFYSEFTKTFKITDFLRDLYLASYSEKTSMMVLDEMNLSRIEYYFADFLSILEYPKEEWKIKVYEPEIGQKLPAHLEGGYVTIPGNTWFIGTANTDDSTFTITDKVYDRAITLDFRERVSPVSSNYISDAINLSSERLQELFDEAKSKEEYCLTMLDTEKFLRICDFIRDAFDIRFGNRIMVQINQFVPVYVALGGTKEAALDFMLASKVLRKLEGMFEDYVKDELAAMTKLINSTYGKGVFVETERIVNKILKRLV